MTGRRLALYLLAAVGFVAVAYSAYWHMAAAQLETGIRIWAEQRRAEGWDVRYASLATGGFPLSIRIHAKDVVVAGARGATGWEARAPALLAEARPWELRAVALATKAPASALVFDAVRGGRFDASIGGASADGRFDAAGRLTEGQLLLSDLAIAGPSVILPLESRALTVRSTRAADGLEMSFSARESILPASFAATLPQIVERLDAKATFANPPPDCLCRAGLDAWRQRGGRIEISGFSLHWGAIRTAAKGSLALDAALQPVGRLETRTTGYREAVGAVEAAGRLSAQDAASLRLALDLLAATPSDGGAPVLEASFSIDNRRLKAGVVPIAILPRLDWPE